MKNFDPHFVYLATNLVTLKFYVGKTSRTVEERWKEHQDDARYGADKHFHRSIRKYGADNFDIQIIGEVGTAEEASNLERIWILLVESYKPEFGYNMTFGGEGMRSTEEVRKKISETKKSQNIKWTDERFLKQSLNLPSDLLIEAYSKGFSCVEIGKMFDTTDCTVAKILRKNGVEIKKNPLKGRPKRPDLIVDTIIREYVEERKTLQQIAGMHGVSRVTISRKLRERGVTIRSPQSEVYRSKDRR
jgi:group I intron endonuclease